MNKRSAALLALMVLPACPKNIETPGPHRPATQPEAASAHVAVLSVARWSEYVDALQPTFALTPDQAVKEVIPTTYQLEQRVLDSLRLGFRMAPPMSSRTTTETSTTENDTTTTASSETRESRPGVVPDDSVLPDARDALAIAPDQSTLGGPSIEPMLKYWAANALYQEVQLLNRYVKDAARRHGFEPYVVRLQLSLLPMARNEPYDAYINVSFFAGRYGETGLGTPQIVPLLVTDSLEGALESRSMSAARQYAFGLLFLLQGFGGGADFDRYHESLQNVLGTDLNSLMTVARVSDNTVRVRLGAPRSPASQFAMIPRSHNVTLLLLVPEKVSRSPDKRTVRAVSSMTLVDAENGSSLDPQFEAAGTARLCALIESWAPPQPDPVAAPNHVRSPEGDDSPCTPANADLARKLFDLAQENDYDGFLSALDDAKMKVNADVLWHDLIGELVASPYASVSFDLPPHLSFEVPQQSVSLVETPGSGARAMILTTGEARLSSLNAVVTIEVQSGGVARKVPVLAEKVERRSDGVLLASFPSLTTLSVAEAAARLGAMELRIYRREYDWSSGKAEVSETLLKDVHLLTITKPAQAGPGFKLTTSTSVITATRGRGTLALNIEKMDAEKIVFRVVGAELESVAPTEMASRTGIEWVVTKNGTFTLTLANLTPDTRVQVLSKNEKGVDHGPIEVRVREPE